MDIWLVVLNMIIFFTCWDFIPTDEVILFQRGRYTTNQKNFMNFNGTWKICVDQKRFFLCERLLHIMRRYHQVPCQPWDFAWGQQTNLIQYPANGGLRWWNRQVDSVCSYNLVNWFMIAIPSGNLTWLWKNGPCIGDIFIVPTQRVIFHSYLDLPEGKPHQITRNSIFLWFYG